MVSTEIRKVKKEEIVVVTSLDVAETFEKRHDNVLRDINNLECSSKFRLLNYEESEYKNSQNKKQPMYYITRDGFTLLVMGYTGEKAMQFKEAYINCFNQMEAMIKSKLIEREKGIAVRHALTKTIQQLSDENNMHGHAYSLYTNLIYKSIFGMDAKKLRLYFGIDKKDNLRDCFTNEQLKAIQNAEMYVSSLIGYGQGYDEIKESIMKFNTNKIDLKLINSEE